MTATIQLQLADALSPAELRELAELAAARGISIERVLFEAAKAEAERIRRERDEKPAA